MYYVLLRLLYIEEEKLFVLIFEKYNITLLIIALPIDMHIIRSFDSKMSQYLVIRTRCPEKFIQDFLSSLVFRREFNFLSRLCSSFLVLENSDITVRKIKNPYVTIFYRITEESCVDSLKCNLSIFDEKLSSISPIIRREGYFMI